MGVGMAVVVRPAFVEEALAHFKASGVVAYEIGAITQGEGAVEPEGELAWD